MNCADAVASSCVAWRELASSYPGMAKGVAGADALVSGEVDSQATNAVFEFAPETCREEPRQMAVTLIGCRQPRREHRDVRDGLLPGRRRRPHRFCPARRCLTEANGLDPAPLGALEGAPGGEDRGRREKDRCGYLHPPFAASRLGQVAIARSALVTGHVPGPTVSNGRVNASQSRSFWWAWERAKNRPGRREGPRHRIRRPWRRGSVGPEAEIPPECSRGSSWPENTPTPSTTALAVATQVLVGCRPVADARRDRSWEQTAS